MAYNFYSAYLTSAPNNSQDYWQGGIENLMSQMNEDAINYFIVRKRNRTTGVFSDVFARVAEMYNSSILKNADDFRKLIFAPETTNPILGDVFEFLNYRWLVIGTDNVYSPIINCTVQRCNVQLRFLDGIGAVMPILSGTPLVIDGIVTNKLMDPIDTTRYYMMPDDMLMLRVANDINTKKIKYTGKSGTRFLFGSPLVAYRTTAIDSVTDIRPTVTGTISDLNGILNIQLKSDTINALVDNVTLKVAKQY
jgi:hypothetical protein